MRRKIGQRKFNKLRYYSNYLPHPNFLSTFVFSVHHSTTTYCGGVAFHHIYNKFIIESTYCSTSSLACNYCEDKSTYYLLWIKMPYTVKRIPNDSVQISLPSDKNKHRRERHVLHEQRQRGIAKVLWEILIHKVEIFIAANKSIIVMDIKTEISNPIAYRDTAHRLTSLIAPPSYTRILVQRKMPIKITAKAKLEWFFFGSWASSSIDFVSFILRPLLLLLVSFTRRLHQEKSGRGVTHSTHFGGEIALSLSLSRLAYIPQQVIELTRTHAQERPPLFYLLHIS